ncbi:MAG: hypothetical protein II336_18200 [Loktanella sp.]|nr:hypothetical protein [Loktanella sp.]
MPTPTIANRALTESQEQAWQAVQEHGGIRAAARALGKSYTAVHGTYTIAKRKVELDPAIQDSMEAVGTGLIPALAWAKTKSTDGTSYSVLLKPQQAGPDDLLDRIRTAFDDIEPAPPITPPENVMADLCSVFPLMDVHLGLHAWGRETGGDDYDLKLALSDMRHAFAKVMAITPPSDTAVLIIGGDFFHADNNNAETPASRHKLDVDGRFDKVVDGGITILVETIDRLLTRHASVIVRALRGNHDENAFRILRVGLAAWYRNEPRVTVDAGPRDLFMYQWGRCALFAHHGDKAKPQQAALYVSDVCPFWSETRHRHFLTGHVHHDQAKDVGPLRWESLRAFCPPDAYAASMGYGARRALQSLTFHKQDGLVLRAMDPIERLPA